MLATVYEWKVQSLAVNHMTFESARRLVPYVQEAFAGVTTGQLLCACVGSQLRFEYTVYGNAINLSARLMVKAINGHGSVLCDNTTRQLGIDSAIFERLQPLLVRCQVIIAHLIICTNNLWQIMRF